MSNTITNIPRHASHRFDPDDEVIHRDSIGADDAICLVVDQTWRVVLDGDDTRVVPTYTLVDVEGERVLDVADTADLVSAR